MTGKHRQCILKLIELGKYMNLDVPIFSRITKEMEVALDKVAEEQERSKSFIVRKALEVYLQCNQVS